MMAPPPNNAMHLILAGEDLQCGLQDETLTLTD